MKSFIITSVFRWIKTIANNGHDIIIRHILTMMILWEHQIKIVIPFFHFFQWNHSPRLTDVGGEERRMGFEDKLELAVDQHCNDYCLSSTVPKTNQEYQWNIDHKLQDHFPSLSCSKNIWSTPHQRNPFVEALDAIYIDHDSLRNHVFTK